MKYLICSAAMAPNLTANLFSNKKSTIHVWDEVGNLYFSLRVYVESRKSVPGSWNEIYKAGHLPDSSLPKIVRELGDFEAKYRFLKESDHVAFPREGRRIVAMSIEPGKD